MLRLTDTKIPYYMCMYQIYHLHVHVPRDCINTYSSLIGKAIQSLTSISFPSQHLQTWVMDHAVSLLVIYLGRGKVPQWQLWETMVIVLCRVLWWGCGAPWDSPPPPPTHFPHWNSGLCYDIIRFEASEKIVIACRLELVERHAHVELLHTCTYMTM